MDSIKLLYLIIKSDKGISRKPLYSIPEAIRDCFPEIPEPEAQNLLSILEDQNLAEDDLIFNISDLQKIFSLIKNKNIFEIIKTSKNSFHNNTNVLGFDIGYWEGDHFSLIADTLITPTWHGPPDDAYPELLEQSRKLNENLLFDSVNDAMFFKKYYKSNSWAEVEYEDDFYIQQIERVEEEGLVY